MGGDGDARESQERKVAGRLLDRDGRIPRRARAEGTVPQSLLQRAVRKGRTGRRP